MASASSLKDSSSIVHQETFFLGAAAAATASIRPGIKRLAAYMDIGYSAPGDGK
jgi:hypothetical protein